MNWRKVSTNSGWLLLEKIVRSVMTIFVGALVIKELGPEQYGKISYLVALIAIFQSIASLGLEGILIREFLIITAENNSRLNKEDQIIERTLIQSNRNHASSQLLITAAVLVRLLTGVILLILATTYMGILSEWSSEAIILTLLMGGPLIFQAADIFDLWNQSRLNSKQTAILKICSYLISNSFRVYLLSVDAGLIFFAAAYSMEVFLIAIGLYLAFMYSDNLEFKFKTQIKLIRSLVRETWPLCVASLSAAIYSRFDQITLGNYLGTTELGIYSAALLFGAATHFLPGIICASVMPEAIRARNEDHGRYLSIMRYTYTILFVLSLFFLSITYFAAELIFVLFYNEEFERGVLILKLYAISNIPIYMGVAHGIWMVSDGKFIISIYRALSGAATAVLLGILLIPHHGMIGAVFSTISALIVADIMVPVILNFQFFRQLLTYNNGSKIK